MRLTWPVNLGAPQVGRDELLEGALVELVDAALRGDEGAALVGLGSALAFGVVEAGPAAGAWVLAELRRPDLEDEAAGIG